jgi:hypothetical protein
MPNRSLAWIGLVAAGVACVAGCSTSQPSTGSLSAGPSPSPSLTPVHLVSKCSPVASSTAAAYDLTLTNTPHNHDVVVASVQVDFYRDGNLVAQQYPDLGNLVIKPGETITLGQFETTSISGRGWTCKMASYVGGERT